MGTIPYLNFRMDTTEDKHHHSLDIKASLPQHVMETGATQNILA